MADLTQDLLAEAATRSGIDLGILLDEHEYDLAMQIAEPAECCADLVAPYTALLAAYGIAAPINCRYEYSPFYRFGRRLCYDRQLFVTAEQTREEV